MVAGLALVVGATHAATLPDPAGGALGGGVKPRVIVTSDIGPGGDIDDEQSMVSALLFADVIDYEALIGTPATIKEVIAAYEKDYANLNSWSRFPSAATLRALVFEGTPAVDRIIACARKTDARPLWICVWGSLGEVADAMKKAPDIRSKIRILAIARQGTGADYIQSNLGDAWWIENLKSFQGVWDGGTGAWSNVNFVNTYVAAHGNLGSWYAVQDDAISWWQGFREGDSPSFLYLLRGNPDNPDSDHWGGRFVKTTPGPNHWVDGTGTNYGEASIAKWRLNYLGEYAKRFDWAAAANPKPSSIVHKQSGAVAASRSVRRNISLDGRTLSLGRSGEVSAVLSHGRVVQRQIARR
jgi:hypothetical protein